MKSDIYIYTETAFHHQGEYDYMLELLQISANSGVNAIKFQVLLDYDYLMSRKHSSYDVLINYTFTKDQWLSIFDEAKQLGLEVILMPLDPKACELISMVKPRYVEIHSICFKDDELLAQVKNAKSDVIVGVGGRNISEIEEIKTYFDGMVKVLMSGFQSFPTKLSDVKLARIKKYVSHFPDLIIGYADHSRYDSKYAVKSSEYALIYGARMFEKHIAVNEGTKRVDFDSAIGQEKLISLKNNIEELSNELNLDSESSLMKIEEPEVSYRNRQKMAIAKSNLDTGHVLTKEDILFRMTGEKTGFATYQEIVGKPISRPLDQNDPILENCFI